MTKNKILQLRVSDYTIELLDELSKRLGLTKSETIRRCLNCMNEQKIEKIEKMFGIDVIETILPFDGAYNIIDFGIIGNYLKGAGFWIDLKANFNIGLNQGFSYGQTSVTFTGDQVFVSGGFLNDIQNALKILYSSHR